MQLYLLGRRLMKIGEATAAGPGLERLPTGLALILTDVLMHPDSSISEITARTGFQQSHVSTSVAGLKARGAVETTMDPADGRRTLVRVTRTLPGRIAERTSAPADAAVAEALGSTDPRVVDDVLAALELLVERLVPDAARAAAPGVAGGIGGPVTGDAGAGAGGSATAGSGRAPAGDGHESPDPS